MSLISSEYKALLHEYRNTTGQHWGGGGNAHADIVADIIKDFEVKTIVDYGCGRGVLLNTLLDRKLVHPDNLQWYDPGVKGCDALPVPADLLVSTDVLEHIEPELLDNVLGHMASLAPVAYINVHTGPAKAILPDGRNAHLTQQPVGWWEKKLQEHWSKVNRWAVGRFADGRPSFLCES